MNRPTKYIVVFDCVLLVQSLINQAGPAARCLELFEERKISLVFSKATLAELRDVLSRSSLRTRFPQITDDLIDRLIQTLLYKGEVLRQVGRYFDYARDPKDEPYLNLAIEAAADFLVTRDNDLLDLMRWDLDDGREFQKRYHLLKIIDPVAFLKIVDEE